MMSQLLLSLKKGLTFMFGFHYLSFRLDLGCFHMGKVQPRMTLNRACAEFS